MTFTGTFNYQNEVSVMKTEAVTERQAREFFCHGLAARYGVKKRVMTNYFNGEKQNFEIKEVAPCQNTK
jgi:hypothetical protein